jgi:hypothetical protein
MYRVFSLLTIIFLFSCTPKGPQTFDSGYIGKSEQYLYGSPNEIKNFADSKAYIYVSREDYFGKNPKNLTSDTPPKKRFVIEFIYYINKEGTIYKYQVWRKKVD